jgi:hypothetical protein
MAVGILFTRRHGKSEDQGLGTGTTNTIAFIRLSLGIG